MAAIQPAKVKGVRGKDRAALVHKEGGWTDAKVVGEFEDGYKLLYLPHPYDVALLGKVMGHCSGTHFVWACDTKIWYFFALVDEAGTPVGTLHCKEFKWLGKAHPLDKHVNRNFYGRAPSGNYPAAVYKTKAWLNKSGGYTNFSVVESAFKEAGIEYEPGKYGPPGGYDSKTYDITPNARDHAIGGFESRFYSPLPNRPAEISEELFAEFQRCWKAMKDEYDAKIGAFPIVARKFKFDKKGLIVLSFSNKSQGAVAGKYRFWLRDWINAHQKHVEGELS